MEDREYKIKLFVNYNCNFVKKCVLDENNGIKMKIIVS